MLINKHIGYKILVAVVITLALSLTAMAMIQLSQQKTSIINQHQNKASSLAETVSQGLQSIMLAGYADVAQSFADNLKRVPEVVDFRVLRTNGLEAFRDSATIDNVNNRIGDEEFIPRDDEERYQILQPDMRALLQAVESAEVATYEDTLEGGERYTTLLKPILNREECATCHGSDHKVRGVIKLTTSLAGVDAQINSSITQAIGLVLAVIVICVLIIGYMVRQFSMPILTVAKELQQMSQGEGDLTVKLPVRGEDEIAVLSNGFNAFIGQIRDLVSRVSDTTVSLSDLSQQMKSTTSATADDAAQQYRDTEDVASGMNELTATIGSMVSQARDAAQVAEEVNQVATLGKRDVEETIESINGLVDQLTISTEAVTSLDADMDNIQVILETIQGISEQTNLLALNAAIEAARAGEQGRGFSVVADEVRNLAIKSRASTDQIKRVIDGLLQRTAEVSSSMELSRQMALGSMEKANGSGASLLKITQEAGKITDINCSIASSTEHELEATEDQNRRILNIKQVAERTVSAAKQTDQTSDALAQQAAELQGLLNKFKT
ncbi:MAG: methyl-accepting chemotaxis protein [Motiliproteus sp.]